VNAIRLLKVLVVVQVLVLVGILAVIVFVPDDVALANSDVAGSFQNVGVNIIPDLAPELPIVISPDAVALSSEKLAAADPGIVLQSAPDSRATRPSFTMYSVHRGDTMMRIAWRFRTTVWSLVRANKLRNVNRIFVGQKLVVPGFGFWDSWMWRQPAATDDHARRDNHNQDNHDNHDSAAPPPANSQAVCNPMISITSPLVNDTVDPNSVAIHGSANLPPEFDPGSKGFFYYKVELGVGERPIFWNVIGSLHYNTLSNGTLETWNTSALANGVYVVRLIAVSTSGQFPPPCHVRVVINR
jgi:LysM repeat protein